MGRRGRQRLLAERKKQVEAKEKRRTANAQRGYKKRGKEGERDFLFGVPSWESEWVTRAVRRPPSSKKSGIHACYGPLDMLMSTHRRAETARREIIFGYGNLDLTFSHSRQKRKNT